MVDAAASGRFDSGRAVRRMFALLKRDIAANLVWSIVLAALPDLAMTYASQHFSEVDAPFSSPANWGMLAGAMLASMLGLVALQAVMARRAAAKGDYGPTSSSGAFGSLNDYLALLALGLVTSLGIMAGFFLLAIPGLILSLAWFVVVPAMVSERLGVMESIRRSSALTREVRGSIFGLWFVVGLVSGIATWLISLLVGALEVPALALVVNASVQAVTGLVNAALVLAVYQDLRESQEGSPGDRLVEVFA